MPAILTETPSPRQGLLLLYFYSGKGNWKETKSRQRRRRISSGPNRNGDAVYVPLHLELGTQSTTDRKRTSASLKKNVCCFGRRRRKLSLSLRMSPSLSLSLFEIKTKERETVVKTFCSSRATDGSMPIFLLGISGVIKEIDLITFGHEKRSCLLSDEASPDQICGTHTLSLFLAIKIRKIPSRGLQSKKKK